METPVATATKPKISRNQAAVHKLIQHMNQRIVGQTHLIDRLIIALLADGHLLVEGAPGLAKTKAIKELTQCIEGDFHRIQFTPDLLPADLTGTEIYRPQDASFKFQPGPIFHHFILADEVNRAPAKVQSAMLEAMAERQVTIGRMTYELPELFLVMATQNPLEQEGTYPLPEAQLDRFLMYVCIDYPAPEHEKTILQLARAEAQQPKTKTTPNKAIINQATVFSARQEILNIHLSDALEDYIVRLVTATRDPSRYCPELSQWLRCGASPRGTISLERCARVHAWLHARDYVSPEDIHAVALDTLRHRVLLNYAAQAENISSDRFIKTLLKHVALP